MGFVERDIERIAGQWGACIDSSANGGCPTNKAVSGRYANPAAYHIGNASKKVAAYVLMDEDADGTMKELDDIAKIMALSDEPASASMKSFCVLRDAVQDDDAFAGLDSSSRKQVMARIDACLLRAMDEYVRARETILKISIDELKRRNKMLENMQDEPYMAARGVRA